MHSPPSARLSLARSGLGFTLLLASLCPSLAGTFKRITIDGSFQDWIGVPLAYEDPADSVSSADYRRIWIANDEDYLYLRFTLERPDDPFTSNDNLFVDADADPTTGFGIIVGSEMLIQGGAGYQEKNGGFNEGAINGLDWQAAPTGTGTDFEMRLSRKARYASDGTEVFTLPSISLLLEAEDSNFARKETAPDAEGLAYEFAAPPAVFTGSATPIPLNASWRSRPGTTDPGSDWYQPDYDDTQAGWSPGPGLLGYSDNPSLYPAPILTPLPTGVATYYLRTRFNWNNDPAGVVFAVTNVLSDGAVLYLNGAEIRRVRIPAGPVTPATPATGGPAAPGQAELFALPTGPLIVGENVLAVEVHQNPASPADLVFGLSLFATDRFPVTFLDPTQPADRAVVGGQSTTFAVDIIASEPVTYQWLKNGVAIPNATHSTLTLDSAIDTDAGTYSVRVSNPVTPAGLTSRAAVLEVLATPLSITRQPAPLEATEGQSARFSIDVSGSAPIGYQWFKGTVALEGATNAVYAIDSLTLADAGEYTVQISNPATPSLSSQPVRLTVLRDTAPPVLVGVAGSPNQVLLTFSEPVDPATAPSTANYTLSGGLAATAASVDPDNPAQVIVATTRQTLGNRYEITVGGLRDRFGNPLASGTRRAFLSTIVVDGSFGDWEGVPQVIDDPVDAENATDYAAAWIANDADFIYLRVRLHAPSQLGIFYNNTFIDADHNLETGFRFRSLGSEMLIQGGGGYQQKNGAFNEGPVEGLDWLIDPDGVASEFEIRFSRRARYGTDGQPVFAGEQIAFYLESENTSFQTIDVAPDADPVVYTLVNPTPVDLGPLTVSQAGGQVRISWTGAGRLQSSAALGPAAAWQDVAGATSPYQVPAGAGSVRYYRLIQ